ncbi:NEL domain-containing protein [Bradyrhizobium sp. ISRA442]|uniref:NEL-type E3 ubiquitin ligase domain-containing protein n=1 Tax=Bradyrhizobium sp. ISRA442 TaxID=2866197 RepID=UPI00311B2567
MGRRAGRGGIWRSFADEPGAEEYSRFLDRLRDTVNYDAFRQAVAEDLRQAAGSPTLREQFLQAAVAASESCEDRIKLNWNGMQNARVNADVLDGAYNEHLDKLLQQGHIIYSAWSRSRGSRAKRSPRLRGRRIAPDMRFVGSSRSPRAILPRLRRPCATRRRRSSPISWQPSGSPGTRW